MRQAVPRNNSKSRRGRCTNPFGCRTGLSRTKRSIKGTFVDYELPKPLRTNFKTPRSLRNDEQQQENTKTDGHHFDSAYHDLHPMNATSQAERRFGKSGLLLRRDQGTLHLIQTIIQLSELGLLRLKLACQFTFMDLHLL